MIHKRIRKSEEIENLPEGTSFYYCDRPDLIHDANGQNITLRYYATLGGTTDEYTPTSEYAEPNEVLEIKWIKISDIENYQWAFKHNTLIESISEELKLKKQ